MNLFMSNGKGLSQEASCVDGKLTCLVSDAKLVVVRLYVCQSKKVSVGSINCLSHGNTQCLRE